MIHPDTEIEYELVLPEDYIKMDNLMEIFRLKEGKTIRTVENMEIRTDMLLYVYNYVTKEFYPRRLHNCTDKVKLQKYFNDGNLFMNKNEKIWK